MSWSDRHRALGPRILDQAVVIAMAAGVALAWELVAASSALAASPSPSALPGGDPRSSGQGPGLVGEPLLAIGVVMVIALLAFGSTLLYVRATGGSHRS
jgi:hypothetical protein